MNPSRSLFAAAVLLGSLQATAATTDVANTYVVSVFDGKTLLMRATLPNDASREITSDSSTGGDGDRPTSFTGNVVLLVKKDGRPLMSLAGDRMELERFSAK